MSIGTTLKCVLHAQQQTASRSKLSRALEIVLSHNTFSAHFLNLLVFCLRLWFVIVCFMDLSLCMSVCVCVFHVFSFCLFCSNLVPLFFIFTWGWIDGEVGKDLGGDEGEKFMIMTYRTEKIHFQFLKEREKKSHYFTNRTHLSTAGLWS